MLKVSSLQIYIALYQESACVVNVLFASVICQGRQEIPELGIVKVQEDLLVHLILEIVVSLKC